MERPDFELEEIRFEEDEGNITSCSIGELFDDTWERLCKDGEKGEEEAEKREKQNRPETSEKQSASGKAGPKDAGNSFKGRSKKAKGKVTKRISTESIMPVIEEKLDDMIARMTGSGEVKTAGRKILQSPTMPLSAASGPGACCLVDTATGQVIQIQGILRVGRDESFADLVPQGNGTISSKHAQITEKGGVLLLRDLDSRNGTFINNERAAKGYNIEISPGDVIRFSNAEYRLEII